MRIVAEKTVEQENITPITMRRQGEYVTVEQLMNGVIVKNPIDLAMALLEFAGWQPMETAPRDGGKIIVLSTTTPQIVENNTKNKEFCWRCPRSSVHYVKRRVNMYNHPKLLPCPFCGGAAYLARTRSGGPWFVACTGETGCEIQPHVYATTHKKAVKTWNTRKGAK